MLTSTRQRDDHAKNLVGFTLGGVEYAVPISRIREIINPLPLVQVSRGEQLLLGVVDHRGEVVPVLDMRACFGFPSEAGTRRTKWVVVKVGAKSVGLVVDGVTEVFGGDDEREVPPLMKGSPGMDLVAGAHLHENRLIFVIDVDRVARRVEEFDSEDVRELVERGRDYGNAF